MKIRAADRQDEPGLLAFLESIDPYFSPPLSARVNLGQWLGKILKLGTVLVSGESQKLTGMIAFYCNDKESRQAFISFLGVETSVRRQGIGRTLLQEAIRICNRERMKSTLVTTWAGNTAAITLYKTFGFKEDDRESRRSGKIALRLTF